MSNMETLKACRNCSHEELTTVLSLGSIYPSNFISSPGEEHHYEPLPLELVKCENCGLVQLKHTHDLDKMYRQYWYQSGLNPSMKNDLKDIVGSIEEEIYITDDDVVLDIGCNDGTLFTYYKSSPTKIGFDPAYNLKEDASKHCDFFVNDYFSSDEYFKTTDQKARVITSIAMFYDLPDPNWFVEEVKKVLDFEGIWVIQFTDLLSMFKINAFDNVCHEHIEYYRLHDVDKMLSDHGLSVFDVEYNEVNGGSLRLYVKHSSQDAWKVQNSVEEAKEEEERYFSSCEGSWDNFVQRVLHNKFLLLAILMKCKSGLVNVAALGASTKGNTLLQVYGISADLINVIGEVNKDKYYLYTIRTNIPIQKEDWVIDHYNVFVVLPWHFRDTFINHPKLQDKFVIFPLPEVTIYHKGREISWTAFLEKALDS